LLSETIKQNKMTLKAASVTNNNPGKWGNTLLNSSSGI
jgi:hypothetical protein